MGAHTGDLGLQIAWDQEDDVAVLGQAGHVTQYSEGVAAGVVSHQCGHTA